MRVLGLDFGERTIGVAVSDPLGITAQGVEVIRRRGLERDLARLGEIAGEFGAGRVVVGLPRNMDGTLGPRARKSLEFAAAIREVLRLDVDTWDERLSTVAAERALLEADLSRGKRRRVIDLTAAVLILQSYLDSGRWRRSEKGD